VLSHGFLASLERIHDAHVVGDRARVEIELRRHLLRRGVQQPQPRIHRADLRVNEI
jgi:hypothetical protein